MGWTKGKKRGPKKVPKKKVAKKKVVKKKAAKRIKPPVKKVNWIKQTISKRETVIEKIMAYLTADYNGYRELIIETFVEELLFYHYTQSQLNELYDIISGVEAAAEAEKEAKKK
jgi:hypothetical protein